MKLIKNISQYLINSNIFVSLCALSLILSSQLVLKVHDYYICIFVFFATLFTYNFQRLIRIKKNVNHPRKEWILNNQISTFLIIIISTIVCGFLFFLFNNNTKILILLSASIAILYPFGIRKIPLLKIFIISLIWTVSTMIIVIVENKIIFDTNTILHVFSRFLFILLITIPFDIRDIKYDTKNIVTIPTLIGSSKSILISILLLVVLENITIYQFIHYNLSLNFLIAITSFCVFCGFLIMKSNKNQDDFYFSFWIESLSIFFYLFLTISLLI